jgi:hypothetical protein
MMSGGHFDYAYQKVIYFARQLERELDMQGEPRDVNDGVPEYGFVPATVALLREILTDVRLASQLMHEAEWLFSGDTGDETFAQRVAEIRRGERQPDET